jgi:arginine decarboxylase
MTASGKRKKSEKGDKGEKDALKGAVNAHCDEMDAVPAASPEQVVELPEKIAKHKAKKDTQQVPQPADSEALKDMDTQARVLTLAAGTQGFVFGHRVPRDYFTTIGWGDTDEGGGADPWETGSYDLALEKAKIHNFNIVTYTSVIPAEAREITYEEARRTFHHGAVLETIMAAMNGSKGDRISAGVGWAKVRHRKDNRVLGGYAAEYKGHAHRNEVESILRDDLAGIFGRRFGADEYEMIDYKFIIQVHEVKKNFGSVLAAICFCSYIYPLLSSTSEVHHSGV